MIFYMSDPMDLLQYIETPQRTMLSLPSGGLLSVEILEGRQARIAEIISTDPMDYMNAELQPGSILNIDYLTTL